jgi:alkanesulfonate monooxygenase
MQLLKLLWSTPQGNQVSFDGEYYKIELKRDIPEPVRPGGPPLYFGGGSPEARDAAAAAADVYLFWGDTRSFIRDGIAEMRRRTDSYNRELRYGLRIHVIARATETEARDAAAALVSRLTTDVGETIKQRSLDRESVGKARQNALLAQGEWPEQCLWTGVGRGRGGVGTAIVGSYDQVEQKLREYIALGIDVFILSGYPHKNEAERFGEQLLPRFQ